MNINIYVNLISSKKSMFIIICKLTRLIQTSFVFLFIFYSATPVVSQNAVDTPENIVRVRTESSVKLSALDISKFRDTISKKPVNAEIIIYSYNEFMEVYSLDDSKEIITSVGNGRIKAYVIFYRNGQQKIEFFEADGDNRAILLDNLSIKINQFLSKF